MAGTIEKRKSEQQNPPETCLDLALLLHLRWGQCLIRQLDDDFDRADTNCEGLPRHRRPDELVDCGLYITSAIAQPTMGRLADCLGARRVYLAGLYLIALAASQVSLRPHFAR